MKELDFNLRIKDYEFKAVPRRLVRFNDEERNETIDFCKIAHHDDGKEYKYSIAYFIKDDEGWDLSLVGNRFFEDVPYEDYGLVMTILKSCLGMLNDFSYGEDNE